MRSFKRWKNASECFRPKHSFFKHLLRSFSFRTLAGLYGATFFQAAYAALNLISALFYASSWLYAVTLYYVVLVFVRIYLIYTYRHADRKQQNKAERFGRTAGLFMIFLAFGLALMVSLLVYRNKSYPQSGIFLLGYAVYAVLSVVFSAIGVIRLRHSGDSVLSAAKAISFAGSAVALLNFQNSLLSVLSNSGVRRLLNVVLGGSSVFLLLTFGVFFLKKKPLRHY